MAGETTTTQTQARTPEIPYAIQHIEIVAKDAPKLRKFLEKQFGWSFETVKMPTGDYHLFRTPGGNGGGLMGQTDPGVPIAAAPYVNVADLGATWKACQKAGVEVLMPVTDVAGMGRFFQFRYAGGPVLACWQAAKQGK